MQQLLALTLHELADRDARPAAHDAGDFLFGHAVTQQGALAFLGSALFLLQLLFELRQLAVFDFGGAVEVVFALCLVQFRVELFNLFTQLLNLADGVLFVFPLGLHLVELGAHIGQLFLDVLKMFLRQRVGFLLQRRLLDLVPHDLAVQLIHFGRHGVHLAADHGAGFINQVDGLIGQEAVGDVAVGKRRRRDQRLVLNLDAVEHLIALLQTAQDGDRVLHGGLVDHHGLEAALQSRILFDVLGVFGKGGRTDAVQLASGQHRLEQVAGVHAAFGLARADDGVQFIDKEDDFAVGLFDLGQNRLQSFLKFAAEFRACDQRAHVQREQLAILQRRRNVAPHDALRQTFRDSGLADAGLTDQAGVVLRLTGQDADYVADLFVAADDGVELVVARQLHQILAVFAQRVVGVLRSIGGHAGVAAHGLERLEEALLGDVEGAEDVLKRAVRRLHQTQHQVLDGNIFVAHPVGLLLRFIERAVHILRDVNLVRLTAGAGHFGKLGKRALRRLLDRFGLHAHLGQHLRDQAVFLCQQRIEQVRLLDLHVAVFNGQGLCVLHSFPGFLRQLVDIHHCHSPFKESGDRFMRRNNRKTQTALTSGCSPRSGICDRWFPSRAAPALPRRLRQRSS